MDIKDIKKCPRCDHNARLDEYLNIYVCDYCIWKGRNIDSFKGNEKLLDEFVEVLSGCISRGYVSGHKDELKELLLKLLNSL
jgi:hypothetical protein